LQNKEKESMIWMLSSKDSSPKITPSKENQYILNGDMKKVLKTYEPAWFYFHMLWGTIFGHFRPL
jgi:hypothetical protein